MNHIKLEDNDFITISIRRDRGSTGYHVSTCIMGVDINRGKNSSFGSHLERVVSRASLKLSMHLNAMKKEDEKT